MSISYELCVFSLHGCCVKMPSSQTHTNTLCLHTCGIWPVAQVKIGMSGCFTSHLSYYESEIFFFCLMNITFLFSKHSFLPLNTFLLISVGFLSYFQAASVIQVKNVFQLFVFCLDFLSPLFWENITSSPCFACHCETIKLQCKKTMQTVLNQFVSSGKFCQNIISSTVTCKHVEMKGKETEV